MIARVRSDSRRRRRAPRSGRLSRRLAFHTPSQRLTAEGWYYLLVIAFIIGGAVLREVNLLVLLAALMIGPLLWNWLLVRWALRRVSATEIPLPRVHAGRPLNASWLLHNDDAKLAAWGVALEEVVEKKGTGGRVRARVVTPCLAPQRSTRVGYSLTFPQRGVYKLGPVRLSTSFPLGLMRTTAQLAHEREAVVWPAVGKLKPSWHQMLRRAQLGQRNSQPRQGRIEGDYYGLREWRPGDSRRWIHWRTTARLNTLTVKQFEQRKDEALTLLVDLWCPLGDAESVREETERVLRFVATIIEDRRRQGEHEVRLTLRAAKVQSWRGVIKGNLVAQMLDALAVAEPASDEERDNESSVWDEIDTRQRQLIVVSTRARPAGFQIAGRRAEVLWIGPDQYSDWFVDLEAAGTDGKSVASDRPVVASPAASKSVALEGVS